MNIVKHWAQRLLNRLGYRISRDYSFAYWFESLLYYVHRKTDEFVFIQIGANEGKKNDPTIYRFVARNHDTLKGIVVEPLKDIFEELKTNYEKYPNITAVNAAIHNSEEEMVLYRADPAKIKGLPKWAGLISSFDKNLHRRVDIPSDVIIPETVPCISFDELLVKYGVTKIDLLQIDAEGYDSEIILNIDFTAIGPIIIRFEHIHMGKATFQRVLDALHNNGYELFVERRDATAYKRNLFRDP